MCGVQSVVGLWPLATLPSKQGLKLVVCVVIVCCMASRYTSIKTRIETQAGGGGVGFDFVPLATLPSKQGLKRGQQL